MVAKSGFVRGETLCPSSIVYAVVNVSLSEAFRSNRVVPKSSRILCTGLLKFLATPVAKPFATCWGALGGGHSLMNGSMRESIRGTRSGKLGVLGVHFGGRSTAGIAIRGSRP